MTGNCLDHIAIAVEDDQATRLRNCRISAIVGRLPTITKPLRSATSAVVKPIPPGQDTLLGSIWAKRLNVPLGAICTMVVPVPCWFPPLLKLLIRNRPSTRFPFFRGTRATP